MTTKRIVIALALIAFLAAIALSPARQWAIDFVGWIRDLGPAAAALYGLVYVVAAVLMIPGSVLTLGGGFIYGPVWGSALVVPASVAASLLAFAISRRFARGWVAKRIAGNPKFEALDRAIARSGFKITLLVRLSPIFPYGLLNYALGITNVRFRDYATATAIGMLPGTVLFVYFGSLVTTVSDLSKPPTGGWLYWAAGAIALVVMIGVTVIARRSLRRELEESPA
ncbi:MAG: TVP38/TMEM64 family protein [Myxococcota bacterium]|nr:TVP38/TMEM64 family protein [Deltaproteobacteria bacterium]MDQ3335720.1 TVP38/TMEM64 family protein [Myxococcota bacterium]